MHDNFALLIFKKFYIFLVESSEFHRIFYEAKIISRVLEIILLSTMFVVELRERNCSCNDRVVEIFLS